MHKTCPPRGATVPRLRFSAGCAGIGSGIPVLITQNRATRPSCKLCGNYPSRPGPVCAVRDFADPGRDIFVLRTETESPGDYRQLYGGMESGHSASRATPVFVWSLDIYSRPVQPLSSSDDVSSFTVGPTRPGICAGMLFVWIVATPIAKARKWRFR